MNTDVQLSPTGIYRLTSVARPVDPKYPTNRALLILLPIGAAAFAVLAYLGFVDAAPLSAMLSAFLVGFAAWAFTRELTPDDDAAAFVALALAWTMSAMTGATSVILTFAALFLARIVNRTTGLAARPWDVLMVGGFVVWASWNFGQPLLAALAALAFAIDARIARGSALSVAAAVVFAALSIWLFTRGGFDIRVWDAAWIIPAVALIGAVVTSVLSGEPRSRCDVYQNPLISTRVHGGLVIGGLVAAQALVHGEPWTANVIWACIAAVPLSGIARAVIPVFRL